jgi:hypothetical protein
VRLTATPELSVKGVPPSVPVRTAEMGEPSWTVAVQTKSRTAPEATSDRRRIMREF